ncbi:glycine zipper 2TM domain-containing protein [Rhodoferax sp.]|uniref:glycine zipper 2TM domain-containing protein n=1 Tax=Rhodoferax sp. TaxID=50421 RepID=UPI00275E1EBE|nr:hypothetical protein [Rhodoferax sp.]
MKRTVLFSLLALGAASSFSQEMGRVISSTPVTQQVGVPRQVCTTEQVMQPGNKSGAGALVGAIAGGAIGNTIGHGSGRAAATAIGLFGGAIVGDRIEGGGTGQVQNVQRCGTQTFYESRTIGYNVVYEYAGKQYTVQMASDPGPFVRLQVTPISSTPMPERAPLAATTYVEPIYLADGADQGSYSYYAAPVVQRYYRPATISLNLGYYGRPYYPRHHHHDRR